MWNLILVRLERVLVLEKDSCTACSVRTIGSEIVLNAPDGTARFGDLKWMLVSVRLDIVLT
jgi:hypothetical protein